MEIDFAKHAPSGATVDVDATVTRIADPGATAAPAPQSAPVAPAAPGAPSPVAAVVPPVAAATAVTKESAMAPVGLVLGDKLPTFDDIILPRLNFGQGIGDLGQQFGPGAIVFNQAALLWAPAEVDPQTKVQIKPASPPVNIVCLGFRETRFVENVVGGGRGLIVRTEEEVRNNGGTLDYNEWKLKAKDGMKRFELLAEALIAIERPEALVDDDSVFVYPVDGKKYALCLWGMKGTAYTAAAKRVFFTNRSMGCLRAGYPTRVFALTARLQKYSESRSAWVPVLVPLAPTSEAFLGWVKQVLNPAQADSTAQAAS